jgi:APA family basic amino acid/polyamine antiporter
LKIKFWGVRGSIPTPGAATARVGGNTSCVEVRAGGQYVYLREAFSPIWGFLYGWTLFLVIQSGTIAAVAVGFARYSGVFIPWISEDHYLIAHIVEKSPLLGTFH